MGLPEPTTNPHLTVPPEVLASTVPPVNWSTYQWLAVAKVVAIMVVPVVLGLISGMWWLAGFKAQLALDLQSLQQRQATIEKTLAGLDGVPAQLSSITSRLDTWAQMSGLPPAHK